MVRTALRNPYAVVVLALCVILIGGTILVRMPVDILPAFKTPAVQVLTTYTGMPTSMMEMDITNRLERWTSQATGIQRQESRSLIGVSVVKNFFEDDADPAEALSQVSALALSDLHYLPPGTLPPIVQLFDPTASTPICLLSISSDTLDETAFYDIAYYQIRNLLSGTPGTIAPAVYGGKVRSIMVYLDENKLQARNLSPMDVVNALSADNIMIPTGDARIGPYDYAVISNAMVPTVEDLNGIPIKYQNQKPVFIRDVGVAKDDHRIQTNIVRIDGRRAVYIPIYRQPGANTIRVVEGVKASIKAIQQQVTHGKELKMSVIMDQSLYVRQAISGLEKEGLNGFVLAAIAILLFLGNVRSTVIVAITLPLAILPAFILLYFCNQSINVMTLGGLALAVGMLLDNAIIVLENISRHLEEGQKPKVAANLGAQEIASAVLVATVTLCIVFFPVTLMTGLGKFLFTPLALAVVFALAASYVMSLMVVPAACARFLKERTISGPSLFERGYTRFQRGFEWTLQLCMKNRMLSLTALLAIIILPFALVTRLGSELFPQVDSGTFTVLARDASGTRPELTERDVAKVEDAIRRAVPKHDLRMIVSNIGLPSSLLAAYTPNAGPQDAFVVVQLSDQHQKSPQAYAEVLRQMLPQDVPGMEFAFDTSGLISSALNFGKNSPIDVQVTGPDVAMAHAIADGVQQHMTGIKGIVDGRVQERLDYPELNLEVDRTRAADIGLNANDVVKNVVTALNSSVMFTRNFWVDVTTGNNYFIGAAYRQSDIKSEDTLADIPITGRNQKIPVPLRNVASISNATSEVEANHVNVRRVINVYANVHGRDIGGTAADVQAMLKRVQLPEGYQVALLGESQAMQESFGSLGFGMVLAVILVYLSMVVLFRSFVDPLIVMASVPPAFTGVVVLLWLTHTTLNVQSLLGTIMVVGLTVSSSVLIVDFANARLATGASPRDAVVEAAGVRLRPILMTAMACILGLVPVALHAGEANMPLARAVIGGLLVSTALKMYLLPIVYSYWKRPHMMEEEDGDVQETYDPRSKQPQPGIESPGSVVDHSQPGTSVGGTAT